MTAQEKVVLGQVLKGLSNSEIAALLFISLSTVKAHLRNILEKTNAASRVAVIHLIFDFSRLT